MNYATRMMACAIWLVASNWALACGDCEYKFCTIGCTCLPKSGCILPHQIDPGPAWNRIRRDPVGGVINPLGPLNTTGIPTGQDVVEFAIKNPDQIVNFVRDPRDILYSPVAAAMVSMRNAVINNSAQNVPDEMKLFLLRWYTENLLDGVRWTSDWSVVDNSLEAAQMNFNPDTQAITVLNAIVFRNDEAANDPTIWAHELVHVQQYAGWGVAGFAREWVNNSSKGGPVESPAYARQAEARLVLNGQEQAPASPFPPPAFAQGLPSGTALSRCMCMGYVPHGASQPAPQCASKTDVPRICNGSCPDGGPVLYHSCL